MKATGQPYKAHRATGVVGRYGFSPEPDRKRYAHSAPLTQEVAR